MSSIDDILKLVKPYLLMLQPYSSARDEFDDAGSTGYVHLDANENPFDSGYNRYPDPHQRALKKSLSEIKGVDASSIFIGNGSDEAIDLIIRLFCDSGSNIIIPSPTYGMYKVSAEINGVAIKTTPLTSTFDIDAKDILTVADKNSRIVFLCSPNNPTGNLLSTSAIENVLKNFDGIVVIDEAYIDFTTNPTWLKRLHEFPNLVVLQTLSKAWGLAGLRLGMAFAHPALISMINKIKPPYNISSVTQAIVLMALTNVAGKDEAVEEINKEKARLVGELRGLTRVKHIYPSDANFVLVRVSNAGGAYQELVKRKIVVRDRSQVKQCEDCLRITVGTFEENNTLLQALKSIPG